jgi:hypothetical protein
VFRDSSITAAESREPKKARINYAPRACQTCGHLTCAFKVEHTAGKCSMPAREHRHLAKEQRCTDKVRCHKKDCEKYHSCDCPACVSS